MNHEFLYHTVLPLICVGLSALTIYLSARLGKAAKEIRDLNWLLDRRGRKSHTELWLARDKNGVLFGYQGEPKKWINGSFFDLDPTHSCCAFGNGMFPEVTHENSPKKVIISC